MKRDLRDLSPDEITGWVKTRGHPAYRAAQILGRLYRRPVFDVGSISDLPAALRQELDSSFTLYRLEEKCRLTSDDGTVKLAFGLADHDSIETVLIPEGRRTTICISTQAGCRMACRFCRTGAGGFRRDLAPSEIVGQVLAALGLGRVSNIVVMGMGEPLDNFEAVRTALEIICDKRSLALSPSRVTLSTIGIPEGIRRLGREGPWVRLAVSLHSAVQAKRARLMPAAKKYGLTELKEALASYPLGPRDKLTVEAVLIEGVNDGIEDAEALADWVSGLKVMVNLIAMNTFAGSSLRPSPEDSVLAFQAALRRRGIKAFIRKSRGGDILAACGQLSGGAPT